MKVGVVGKAEVIMIGDNYAVGIVAPRPSSSGTWYDSVYYLCQNDDGKYYVDALHLNAVLYGCQTSAQKMVDKYNTPLETFN